MRERSHSSIARRLSRWLAIQTFAALAVVCGAVYYLTNVNLERRHESLLRQKMEVVQHLVAENGSDGDVNKLRHKLDDFFYGRPDFSLILNLGSETLVYGKPLAAVPERAKDRRTSFELTVPGMSERAMTAELVLDTSADMRLRAFLAWTLFACALAGAIVVSAIGSWLVRRGLAPLADVGMQASRLSPERIGERLNAQGLDRELLPLVGQFNLLLQRLERAYVQIEGFNSDVAHELRTPLANLIGETELALRTRPVPPEMRDLLGSNLEELQRLASIVNDMLFLSQVDRGAKVRGQWVASLAAIASEVAAYHEAEALEADVQIVVTGDASASIDRALLQRAISNLLSNAARYADRGSTIEVEIRAPRAGAASVSVRNSGLPIGAEHLPRLFHRFYRVDESRHVDDHRHGLGLAIVAAIARMHGGESFAKSNGRATLIGFNIATATHAP